MRLFAPDSRRNILLLQPIFTFSRSLQFNKSMYNLGMDWCFAIVNGRLAEIFFERKNGKMEFLGHAYVKKSEYKTKKEKKWIKEDTEKFKLVYRKGIYKDKTTGEMSSVSA